MPTALARTGVHLAARTGVAVLAEALALNTLAMTRAAVWARRDRAIDTAPAILALTEGRDAASVAGAVVRALIERAVRAGPAKLTETRRSTKQPWRWVRTFAVTGTLIGARIQGTVIAGPAEVAHTNALTTNAVSVAGSGLGHLAFGHDVTGACVNITFLAHPAVATIAFSFDANSVSVAVFGARVDVTRVADPALITQTSTKLTSSVARAMLGTRIMLAFQPSPAHFTAA